MNKDSLTKEKLNNSGFSIVELIIAVAILATVAIPIMKSFSTATVTTFKAQSIQNATSIAEKVMEEVKAVPGKTIETYDFVENIKTDDLGNPVQDALGNNITYKDYRLRKTNQTATSGEQFDVFVEFSEGSYNTDVGKTDVSDINSMEFPDLYAVDSDKHIVVSWEMNSYDASAVENLAYKANAPKSSITSGGEKKTTITLTGGDTQDISAQCDVTYTYSGKELKYTVFNKTASDIAIEDGKKNSGGPHVYLFYTTTNQINATDYFQNEKIVIHDDTATPVVSGKSFKQDYYVILQNIDTPGKVLANPGVTLEGSAASSGTLYANFASGVTNSLSTLYDAEEKQRIYDVKVKVYKAGTYTSSQWPADGDGKKLLAELKSTIRVY